MKLARPVEGRLRMISDQVPLWKIEHELSRTYERFPFNRTFIFHDKEGNQIGEKTFFIIGAHSYCIQTPQVKPDRIGKTAMKIEDQIKKGLMAFRASRGQRSIVRYSVDVEPIDASALSRKHRLWRATVSELVRPEDIPDST